jgi:MFS family permease
VYTLVVYVVIASIDNTVLALIPTLAPQISGDLGLSNRTLGSIIALKLVVVAITALLWGYRSDQTDRRQLLIVGTLAWALPVALIPSTTSPLVFVGLVLLAAVGLGCIATVGYSIITDLVPERRRGLMLGVWGGAQAVGTVAAGVIAGLMSPSGWRAPFGVMAGVGIVCSGLALFALPPRTGAADTALASMGGHDDTYDYRIELRDLPFVLRKSTNAWLMLQGFWAQFAFGSLTWVTVLLTAKLMTQGFDLPHANAVAALLWVFLQVGAVVSLLWGWLGDRLRQRHPNARALIAAYGFWTALPCFVVLFWVPMPLLGTQTGTPLHIVLYQLAHNGWWWVALLGASLAIVAQAANAPNWFALVTEVNLPEHRGTAFSFITLANNLGRALGAFLVGVTFDWLQHALVAPLNYALGLSLFQLFFIPAGLCCWMAARSTARDVHAVQTTLRSRVSTRLMDGEPFEQIPVAA